MHNYGGGGREGGGIRDSGVKQMRMEAARGQGGRKAHDPMCMSGVLYDDRRGNRGEGAASQRRPTPEPMGDKPGGHQKREVSDSKDGTGATTALRHSICHTTGSGRWQDPPLDGPEHSKSRRTPRRQERGAGHSAKGGRRKEGRQASAEGLREAPREVGRPTQRGGGGGGPPPDTTNNDYVYAGGVASPST